MNYIKIITFCIGVDVLGFPLTHTHKLTYKNYSSRVKNMFFKPNEYHRSVDRTLKTFKNKNQLKK